jgi:hypothetical protein
MTQKIQSHHALHWISFTLTVYPEPIEPNSALVRYQSIDKQLPHIDHYKCHIKDKAKFKSFQNNDNNMVAASWPFHQMMDGLNTPEGIPLVALSVQKSLPCRNLEYDNLYAVTLLLEFYYTDLAQAFAAKEGARKLSDESWETVVYFHDKVIFQECIEWKWNNTQSKWRDHDAFLDLE